MSNATISEALKEAFALAPKDVVYLETLEIKHPQIANPIYLVRDKVSHVLTLETGVAKTFEACAFRMNLPSSGDNGLQELNLAIDNIDRRVSDFVYIASTYDEPVTITFRPYLSNEPTVPQMDPPLELFLTDIVVTQAEVSGKATFADILNKQFPTERYTRARFPSLGN
jgi:hypothetical protein